MIVLKLDPGGNCPVSALTEFADSLDATARISPVPGRTATTWVGSSASSNAASAASWTAGTSGVCSGSPGTGSRVSTTRPASSRLSSVLATETV